jgi:hypothetical protein
MSKEHCEMKGFIGARSTNKEGSEAIDPQGGKEKGREPLSIHMLSLVKRRRMWKKGKGKRRD